MTLKQRVHAGERLVGGLLRLPAETLVEVAGVAGMDFVLIDCEHGPADVLSLQQHIAAAEAHGLAVLVRVGVNEPQLVLRALDVGATGIVVPHVDTADDASRAVRSAHYPPRGERGVSTYSRAGRFGATSIAEQLRGAEQSTVVVAMLETSDACENADEILAVDGIDAVMVGPADLSVALGLTGGPSEPAVGQLIDGVRKTAQRVNRPVMSIVSDVGQAAAAPAGLIVYNLTDILLRTFRELAAPVAERADDQLR